MLLCFLFQLESASLAQNASFSGNNFISPLKLYQISADPSQIDSCPAHRCSISAEFKYLADESCKFGFICPSLPSHSCATYGLELSNPGLVDPLTYCHSGRIISGTEHFNEGLTLSLWYTNSSTESPRCYLWCTDDGLIPGNSEGQKFLSNNMLLKLVSFLALLGLATQSAFGPSLG